jgi:hypothetical protein
MTWEFEYYDGGYMVRRHDMTRQVWLLAPQTNCGNVATGTLCQWMSDLEAANAQLLEALMILLLEVQTANLMPTPDTVGQTLARTAIANAL